MQKRILFFCCLMIFTGSPVFASDSGTVSIEEFNELKANYEQLKKEVQELKQGSGEKQKVTQTAAPATSEGYVSVDEFNKLKDQVEEVRPGLSNVVLSGYGFSGFTDTEGGNSTFSAGLSPIMLWKVNDKLLFEAEPEFELEDGTTKTALEYADMSYFFNDYITFVAGKFLNPFGVFTERLHPKWINKLADKPFGYPDGTAMLAPETQIGAEVRGGIPLIGQSKAKYAFYASNGPTLQTTAANAGELAFSNTNDNNNNKAFGGRVGFLPVPELEVGYSWEKSRVGSNDTAFYDVYAFLQGVDLSYVRDFDPIKGTVDFRAEQIWSQVDPVDYATAGGKFKNDRQARYFQLAYRPSKLNLPIVKNLEPVFRFDQINQPPNAPTSIDRNRYTWGLNYWMNPSTVAKVAYESEYQSKNMATNHHSLMLQMAVGF